jgi:predicted MFS family arabinose efflux permease
LGSISLIALICIPVAGRLADVLGVTRTVMIGMVTLPISFVLYSLMTGPMWQYVAIYLFQTIFCITMTSAVYSRLAVQYVELARGLALAIVAVGPNLTGVIAGPLLNAHIEAHGWRSTYLVLAGFSVVASIITLLLLPPERRAAAGEAPPPKRRAREDYPEIFRNRVFWILAGVMLLCNLSQVLALSQLKLLMIDNGVSAAQVGALLAAFPIGVLGGRFVAGAALDRWSVAFVGLLCMGLPSFGMVVLATSYDAYWVLMTAVVLIGFSYGSEGDIIAYAVAGRFGVSIYGSVMGLMTMAASISTSVGALLLSYLLGITGNFNLFLVICAAASMAGALMFLLLRDGQHR